MTTRVCPFERGPDLEDEKPNPSGAPPPPSNGTTDGPVAGDDDKPAVPAPDNPDTTLFGDEPSTTNPATKDIKDGEWTGQERFTPKPKGKI